MPTKNTRINIILEEPLAVFLANLAKQEHKSVSRLAKELLLDALERREDMALSVLAEARDAIKAKRIKHDDTWK